MPVVRKLAAKAAMKVTLFMVALDQVLRATSRKVKQLHHSSETSCTKERARYCGKKEEIWSEFRVQSGMRGNGEHGERETAGPRGVYEKVPRMRMRQAGQADADSEQAELGG